MQGASVIESDTQLAFLRKAKVSVEPSNRKKRVRVRNLTMPTLVIVRSREGAHEGPRYLSKGIRHASTHSIFRQCGPVDRIGRCGLCSPQDGLLLLRVMRFPLWLGGLFHGSVGQRCSPASQLHGRPFGERRLPVRTSFQRSDLSGDGTSDDERFRIALRHRLRHRARRGLGLFVHEGSAHGGVL